MLVLSRKVGEQIVIGDNITVVVNKVAGNRISLGINAPSNVRIVRGELKESVSALDDDAKPASLPLPGVSTFPLVADAVVHRAR
jgi:carbon storage regulator